MQRVILTQEASEWRAIAGYEGIYTVNREGLVRREATGRGSFPGRILKPKPRKHDGRVKVSLNRGNTSRTFTLARLVAEAWVPGRTDERNEVNHINGDPADNRADNLEWVTRSENMHHAYRTGLLVAPRGERQHKARLTANQVRRVRKLNEPASELADLFGVTKSAIYNARLGWSWRHIEGSPR